MSHTVTVTRTTTTSTGTAVFVNTGYFGTLPGLVKLAQLLIGGACVGIVGYAWEHGYTSSRSTASLFFFLMSVAFLIGTFCIVASSLISFSTASLLSKTMFDVIYHSLAFALYLAASITLLVEVNDRKNSYGDMYKPTLAAAIMGLVLAALYLLSAFYANRSFRGL